MCKANKKIASVTPAHKVLPRPLGGGALFDSALFQIFARKHSWLAISE